MGDHSHGGGSRSAGIRGALAYLDTLAIIGHWSTPLRYVLCMHYEPADSQLARDFEHQFDVRSVFRVFVLQSLGRCKPRFHTAPLRLDFQVDGGVVTPKQPGRL
ncbi:hypothetical protein VTK56DRAFT_2676 [Thermocarpiscus australiensis]